MFGVSFPELVVLGTVALLVLGPEKLPGMLRTMGQWVAKLRRLTTEVRYQSGIDEVLRAEGFDGGLNELRSIMRGGGGTPGHVATVRQPTAETFVSDKTREYPAEGPDAYGALPEDLVAPAALPSAEAPAALPPAEAPAALPPAEAPTALPSAEAPAALPEAAGAEPHSSTVATGLGPTPAPPAAPAASDGAPGSALTREAKP